MARAHVPQFGKWDAEGDVPYTIYFDKARQGRGGGRMINPNDPQENPEAFGNPEPPARTRTEQDEPVKRGPTQEGRASREDQDLKQDNVGRKADVPPQYQGNQVAGEGNKRPSRTSFGSEQSIDRSPLHPHYQAKITGRGSGSPSWEGKASAGHGTPGRSRLRGRDDDIEKGAAVPKFGEWDEANPASAEVLHTSSTRCAMKGTLGHPALPLRTMITVDPTTHMVFKRPRVAVFHGANEENISTENYYTE